MKRTKSISTYDRKKKKRKYSKRGPRWNTLDARKRFKHHIEGVLKHTLVDSEETWVSNGYNAHSKPPVICGKCGARNESAEIFSIMNHGNNIGCACRHQSKWRPPALPTTSTDNCKKGDDAVNYLIGLIQDLNVWEVAKMREATQADLAVRRKGSKGDWLPVQVKSCSTGTGKFQNLHGYANMVLCLVDLTFSLREKPQIFDLGPRKGGEFWLGRRDDFPPTGVCNIRGKKCKKQYEPYRVLDASNLNDRLHSLDTDSYIIKRSLDYLNVPSHWTQRREHLSQILFRAVLTSFEHTMSFPKYENTATDWYVNNSTSVQDKTAGGKNCLQYLVNLRKKNGSVFGKRQYQPYAAGDNDLYLVFVLDKAYEEADFEGSPDDFMALAETASLRGCYMFREADLLATGHIATATQSGKVTLGLPVPNADGTFEAKITRGSNRMHNFQPHYFHKTKFKALMDHLLTSN